ITGQVLDVGTGHTVASLKATGDRRDLFRMEDILAEQVMTALPRELTMRSVPQPPANYGQPNQNAQAAPPSDESGYYVTPPQQQYVYTHPSVSYPVCYYSTP